jgi:uncharacterized membrane protein
MPCTPAQIENAIIMLHHLPTTKVHHFPQAWQRLHAQPFSNNESCYKSRITAFDPLSIVKPDPAQSRFDRIMWLGLILVFLGVFLSFWQPTVGLWRPPTPAESVLFTLGGILALVGFALIAFGLLPFLKSFLSELGFHRRKP